MRAIETGTANATSRCTCSESGSPVLQTAALAEPRLLHAVQMHVGSSGATAFRPNPLAEGEGGSPNPILSSFPPPVLAGLEIFKRDGLKILDVRRRRSRLVSKISVSFEYFKEPRSGPDCGSPFLCLLSFGEAKESELPPGNPRQTQPSKVIRYKFKSYQRKHLKR